MLTISHDSCCMSCSYNLPCVKEQTYNMSNRNNNNDNTLTTAASALRALSDSYISEAVLWLEGCCCIHSRTSGNRRGKHLLTRVALRLKLLFDNATGGIGENKLIQIV